MAAALRMAAYRYRVLRQRAGRLRGHDRPGGDTMRTKKELLSGGTPNSLRGERNLRNTVRLHINKKTEVNQ